MAIQTTNASKVKTPATVVLTDEDRHKIFPNGGYETTQKTFDQIFLSPPTPFDNLIRLPLQDAFQSAGNMYFCVGALYYLGYLLLSGRNNRSYFYNYDKNLSIRHLARDLPFRISDRLSSLTLVGTRGIFDDDGQGNLKAMQLLNFKTVQPVLDSVFSGSVGFPTAALAAKGTRLWAFRQSASGSVAIFTVSSTGITVDTTTNFSVTLDGVPRSACTFFDYLIVATATTVYCFHQTRSEDSFTFSVPTLSGFTFNRIMAIEEHRRIVLLYLPTTGRQRSYLMFFYFGPDNKVTVLNYKRFYSQNTNVPTITSFTSSPAFIDEDASPPRNITLTFAVTNSDHNAITNLTTGQPVALTSDTTAVIARPTQTTRFGLVSRNTYGSTSSMITVPVYDDPVISSLSVEYVTNPFSPHGATVYLEYTVSGKPFPTLSADHGIGVITPRHTNLQTGVGRIAHTFAGPDNFNITLTATNVQANNQSVSVTRSVNVIIP